MEYGVDQCPLSYSISLLADDTIHFFEEIREEMYSDIRDERDKGESEPEVLFSLGVVFVWLLGG